MIKRIVVDVLVISCLYAAISFAQEIIASFDEASIPYVNEELQRINRTLNDHEVRLTAGGH